MRLNQFLARAGVCSRRGGDELISRGAVTVNGAIVKVLGTQVEPDKDAVKVNGKRVFAEHVQYFLFNKPDGVMCTLSDPEGRPHLGDVIRKLGGGRLYPVGRLDFNTEGLLLLTNDGDLAQKLLHPKFQVARTYEAKVQGILTTDEFDKFASGIRLEDGWATAEVKPIQKMQTNSYVGVTVREGRNRLVRRIFEAAGHPIIKLQRIGFGPLSLGGLVPGEVRRMTPEEIKALLAFASRGPSPSAAPSAKKSSGKPSAGGRESKKSFGGSREGGFKKNFGGPREGGPSHGDHKSTHSFGSVGAKGPGPKKSYGGPREGGFKKSFGGPREGGPKKSFGGPRDGGPPRGDHKSTRSFGSAGAKGPGPKKSFGGSYEGGPKKSFGGSRDGRPGKSFGGPREGSSRPRKYTGSYNPAGPKKKPKDHGPG